MKKPLWNSFRDPPPEKATGSAANWNKFQFWIKLLKLFVFLLVFGIILMTSILAKLTYLLMTSQISKNNIIKYCDIRNPNREIFATMTIEQRIPWIWMLIFAFSAPEIFTFLRVARCCYFKNIRRASILEFAAVMSMEILHTIGMALFTFVVLPDLTSSKGLMLINCVCFIPALLGLLSGLGLNWKSLFVFLTSCGALCCQITGLFLWPLIQQKTDLWLIPISLILISCRWWENFCSILPKKKFLNLRQKLTESRSYIYLYLAPLKIIIFSVLAFLTDGQNFGTYFHNLWLGWPETNIPLIVNLPIYTDQNINNSLIMKSNTKPYNEIIAKTSQNIQICIILVHILCSYLCYICAKFSCKIKIQEFSFAFALTISSPIGLIILYIMCGLRETNVCLFHNILTDYLTFNSQSSDNLIDFMYNEYIYVWLLWWLSQMWIVRHIWFPVNDKNASTEKLFIVPWYNSLIIDQCIMLNRRILDQEKFVEYMDSVTFIDPETTDTTSNSKTSCVEPSDSIPQLIVCATMWHEEEEEMMQFLKSIIRLDEDQCARRMSKEYFHKGVYDEEYYELESNIFFDDAFITDPKFCADSTNPPINTYVETLINCIDKAALAVYGVQMIVQPPTKAITPYGGRLVWTLPGRTKMIAHLKNNDKIRNKKRWSQVMYMYYLLGYRIMEMDEPTNRKIVIAQNTFLLALDGDIDFQPQAVQLLLGRMKVDPDLGAACGRIHPVGQGPMVWYQIFEYAIGHWLQKATEHVIGCVLCSPGCFSLFRGRALMEDSVMKKYTTIPTLARHFVQYDQGEDRWLCTLLLKQKFRVEYSAASDAYTHSPESFNDFYIQRRRWIPSTIANILDLLSDAKLIVQSNNSISMPYICYQGMIMVGTILGPGTIFLMMVGSLVTVFNIDIWTSFMYNFLPVLTFMLICFYAEQKYQLITAFIISSLYCLVMMAVLIGIIIQVMEDGIMSPASLFFVAVAAQIVITGLLHPQEAGALICGVVYYITIPSMYMLLLIYSVFNMNDVSWGTREKKPEVNTDENTTNANAAAVNNKKNPTNKIQQLLNVFRSNQEEEGSIDFSFAGVFRCMFCMHAKSTTAEETQLLLIADRLADLSNKVKSLESYLVGDVNIDLNETDDFENSHKNTKPDQVNFHINPNQSTSAESKYITGWLDNPTLKSFNLGELSLQEKKFWDDLIKEYLHPLFKTDAEKQEIRDKLRTLRNIVVFAFVMINALFVLIVFLLQIKKSYLHIRWPFNAKDTIEFEKTTFEVTIYREYLELDPIGSCFVLFFGLILAIQFIAMLVHRFGTISQILAATDLNWFLSPKHGVSNAVEELKGNGVEIAKKSQRPRKLDDDDSDEEENHVELRRKNTLCKLLDNRNLEMDARVQSDLQTNFEIRYHKGKLKFENIPISRQSIRLIEENRKSIIQDRSKFLELKN